MGNYGILRKAIETALIEKKASCAKVNGLLREIANLKQRIFHQYFYEKKTIKKDGATFRYVKSEYGSGSFLGDSFSLCAYFLREDTEPPTQATKAEVELFKKYEKLVKDIDFGDVYTTIKIINEAQKIDNKVRWLKNGFRFVYDAYFKFDTEDFLDERFLDTGYRI